MQKKFSRSERIPSGFKPFDIAEGGYLPGIPTVVMTRDFGPGEQNIRKFICNQAKKFALDQKRKTLLISTCSDSVELAKTMLPENRDIDSIEQLARSNLFIVKYDEEGDYPESAPRKFIEYIDEKISREGYEALLIENAEYIFGDISTDCRKNFSFEFLRSLRNITAGKNIPVILTEFDNVIGTGNGKETFPEIVMHTDIYGRVQMSIHAQGEMNIVDNLYGFNYDSAGVNIIDAERRRQKIQEGYTPEHDLQHTRGELADAAATYALTDTALAKHVKRMPYDNTKVPPTWPFDPGFYKPTPGDRIRQLAKAGAFIAAEIDRLLAQK